ncbi:MAG: hypothetical protein Tsb002_23630 [Wenzhouxiangellaceae bacterium]
MVALVVLFWSGAEARRPAAELAAAPPGDLWIVELEEPGLVDAMRAAGESFDRQGSRSRAMEQRLTSLQSYSQSMAVDAGDWLRREISPQHYYSVGLTGFAASMSSAEAQRFASMPGVKAVHPNVMYAPQLDAGPEWIGARDTWDGPVSMNS